MNGWVQEPVVMQNDARRSDGVALGCVFGTCVGQFVPGMPVVGFNMSPFDAKIRSDESDNASSGIEHLGLGMPLTCTLHGLSNSFSIVVDNDVLPLRCGGDLQSVKHARGFRRGRVGTSDTNPMEPAFNNRS